MAFVGAWTARLAVTARSSAFVSQRAVFAAPSVARRSIFSTPARMQYDAFEGEEESAPPAPRTDLENNTKLFVGNLAWAVEDTDLEDAFSAYGAVVEAKVIRDRESGRSRGFGFVTYDQPECVEEALEALHGTDLLGREIRVNKAESKPRTGGFRSGGGGGGGYGRRDGGYGGGGNGGRGGYRDDGF